MSDIGSESDLQCFSQLYNSLEFVGENRLPEKNLQNLRKFQTFNDQSFIELHKIHGNKWKNISNQFENTNDSFIKNHFYSLLRRALRKINGYIRSNNKVTNSRHKLLKLNFVFKLTNLAQSQKNGFSTKKLYTNLLYTFLSLRDLTQNKTFSGMDNLLDNYFETISNESIEELIIELRQIENFFLEHNLNKKGKSKKKCPKKLLLKKDSIQQSIKLKQSLSLTETDETQKQIQCQTPGQFGPLLMTKFLCQDDDELLSFDLEKWPVHGNDFVLRQQFNFDQVLFR